MSPRYILPWPSLGTMLKRLFVAATAVCLLGGAGDAYWDYISSLNADIRASQEQQQRSEAIVAELNTPEGQEKAKQQIEADQARILVKSIELDPEQMTRYLPCAQWPKGYWNTCEAHGGNTTWTPPPPVTQVTTETEADRRCGHLSKADSISCYAEIEGW